jgi:hypothetical protein
MSFSYTPGGATDLDRIRLEIGDQIDGTASNESLHDEEVADLVARHGSWQRAVAPCARALAMKLSSLPTSKTTGQLQIVQKRADYLLEKAVAWERSGGGDGVRMATASAGSDTDRPRSAFTRPTL